MQLLIRESNVVRNDSVYAVDSRVATVRRAAFARAVAMAAANPDDCLWIPAPIGRSAAKTLELWEAWRVAIRSLGVSPAFVLKRDIEVPQLAAGECLIVAGPDAWAFSRPVLAIVEAAHASGALVHYESPRVNRWRACAEIGVFSICYADSEIAPKFSRWREIEEEKPSLALEGEANDTRSRVIALVSSGASFAAAGRAVGLSAKTAWVIARDWATRKAKRLDAEKKEIIRQRLGVGRESFAAIAKEVGCHKSTVAALAKEWFPADSGVAKEKRCKSCGALINTVFCLRCSLS